MYAAHHFDSLDGCSKDGVTGVILVTFTIIQGSLILLVNHDHDLAGQCISKSSELTQIGTQDDDVALCRVASLPRKRVSVVVLVEIDQ